METVVYLTFAAVLSTAELCMNPLPGDSSQPDLCLIESTHQVSTPFFSVTVEPGFFVGVDREGRRMVVTAATRQSQAEMEIEVLPSIDANEWGACPKITETVEEHATWRDCGSTPGNVYERKLVASLASHEVLIRYVYTASGTPHAPALERMTQSVRVHAKAE